MELKLGCHVEFQLGFKLGFKKLGFNLELKLGIHLKIKLEFSPRASLGYSCHKQDTIAFVTLGELPIGVATQKCCRINGFVNASSAR